MHRPHDIVVVGHRGFRHRARDAEIRNLDVAVRHDEDVVRLDIAVNKVVRVRLCKRPRDLTRDMQRLGGGHGSLLLDALLQRTSRNVFHDDVVPPLGDADIVDVDDVWMRNARCRLRLALKTRNELRVILVLLVENLDGDGALQELILCPIDICHPAAAY